MFKPAALRVAAITAMVSSVLGLLFSLMLARQSGAFALGVLSWVLLWASFLGFKLAGYKLYDEECKKSGIHICLMISNLSLFLFVDLVVGLVLAVALLGTLWGLKRNYDEWQPSAEPEEAGEV